MKTLAELIAAYKSGEITEPMELDNDEVYVLQPHDDEWLSVTEHYRAHPDTLLEQLLDYVGIPHQHV
jgi:hypothetical protein